MSREAVDWPFVVCVLAEKDAGATRAVGYRSALRFARNTDEAYGAFMREMMDAWPGWTISTPSAFRISDEVVEAIRALPPTPDRAEG